MSREIREGLLEAMEETREDIREEVANEVQSLHKRMDEVEESASKSTFIAHRQIGVLRETVEAIQRDLKGASKSWDDYRSYVTMGIAILALVISCMNMDGCSGCQSIDPDIMPAEAHQVGGE